MNGVKFKYINGILKFGDSSNNDKLARMIMYYEILSLASLKY